MPLDYSLKNGKFGVFYLTTSFRKIHTTPNCILLCPLLLGPLLGNAAGVSQLHMCSLLRYRPAQKTDSLGDSGSHGSLHSTPEQAMAAQSQHHQQYIGEPPPWHRTCKKGSGATQHLWGWVLAPAASTGMLSLDSVLIHHLFNYIESSREFPGGLAS